MHQVASDMNKAKREPFLNVNWLRSPKLQQVTAYRKIFSGGYPHLMHGRTIMLLAGYAMAGLQSGSFRETRFRNGERQKYQVYFCGSMGNVC